MPKHTDVNHIKTASYRGGPIYDYAWLIGNENTRNTGVVWTYFKEESNRWATSATLTPDQAEEIAYMLLYEAKLAREANGNG